MKIAFTICSNNYLAQAKALGDSLLATNPDFGFFIGLVDRLQPQIDYKQFHNYSIIPIEDIGIPNIDSLFDKFNIIELNTAVKPAYLEYFFRAFPDLDYLFYFDPDIMVFASLTSIIDEFTDKSSILLTPHILSPIPLDGKFPDESTFLKYGIYNLGFIALKKDPYIFDFIDWWKERTFNLGFMNAAEGLFVDQLWINLAPLYYSNIKILSRIDCNMAPWNLHERSIICKDDSYWVNNLNPLLFYHFSSYNYLKPDNLSKYYNRYSFENTDDLHVLYDKYNKLLIENGIADFHKIPCYYEEIKKSKEKQLKMEQIRRNKLALIKFHIKNIFAHISNKKTLHI